jgi:hypothetical protein
MSPTEWDNSVCMRGPRVVRAFLLIKRELFQRRVMCSTIQKSTLYSIIKTVSTFLSKTL